MNSLQRTEAIIASIDDTLANINERARTRTHWTAPEIVDLLLDVRNELQLYAEFDRFEAQVAAIRKASRPKRRKEIQ